MELDSLIVVDVSVAFLGNSDERFLMKESSWLVMQKKLGLLYIAAILINVGFE